MATKSVAAAVSDAASDPGGEAGSAEPRSRKKLLSVVGGALGIVGLGVGGWFFWQHRQVETSPTTARAAPLPLIYLALDPPFVVNFEDGQAARFLQVDVRISSRDPGTIALIRDNEPLVRNDLLMLFGAQNAVGIGSRDGKDKLRAEALSTVRRVVKTLGGKPESLEAVLFASFVIQ